MTRLALAALCTLAGCDSLFSLVHVPEPERGDAQLGDGRERDAMIDGQSDAKLCVPIGHNEDTDNIDDGCDSCLSVVNMGIDADGDGVDDACDPDPLVGHDAVLFATGFPDPTGFAIGFGMTGTVTFEPGNKGRVTLFQNATLAMRDPYRPTKIVVRTSGVGQGVGAQVDVTHSGASCIVLGSDCQNTVSTLTCLMSGPGGGTSGLTTNSANVKIIELRGPAIQCHIAASSQTATLGTTETFTTDVLQFATSTGGSLIIDSIEIFGTQ